MTPSRKEGEGKAMTSIQIFMAFLKKPLRLRVFARNLGSFPPPTTYTIRNMPNSRKRAFFKICPRKNARRSMLLLTTGHWPQTTYLTPTPQSVKRPHRKKVPAQKTHNSRENMPSPHPLARDADLNLEKYNPSRLEKIRFPRVFEVFSIQPSDYFPDGFAG
jgi:hypothetical protein